MTWHTKHGLEELPQVQGQGSSLECQAVMVQEWPRGATKVHGQGRPGGDTPPSKARGGSREELPHVRGQGWPGEATSYLRPGAVNLRSHPGPEAKGGSWEEPPTPEART